MISFLLLEANDVFHSIQGTCLLSSPLRNGVNIYSSEESLRRSLALFSARSLPNTHG